MRKRTWSDCGRFKRRLKNSKPGSENKSIRSSRTFSSAKATTKPWNSWKTTASKRARLARIQLDDQLFVDDRLHFFTRRDMRDFSSESVAIDRQPIRHRYNLSELEIAESELPRFRFVFDRDLVAGFHIEGSDVDVAIVDLDVPMRHELARRVASVVQT